jgi:hypothetical protein
LLLTGAVVTTGGLVTGEGVGAAGVIGLLVAQPCIDMTHASVTAVVMLAKLFLFIRLVLKKCSVKIAMWNLTLSVTV